MKQALIKEVATMLEDAEIPYIRAIASVVEYARKDWIKTSVKATPLLRLVHPQSKAAEPERRSRPRLRLVRA